LPHLAQFANAARESDCWTPLLLCKFDFALDSEGAKFVCVQRGLARSISPGWMPHLAAGLALAATLALIAACTSQTGFRYSNLELRPGRYYSPPGSPSDPWGPYIRDASQRFGVPVQWIRAVIREESAGEVQALSPAGAIGLMQVMPGTYEMLREEYDLGDDPFEPHDNILAGTAYIQQMYRRYGAPGFLAAYNAGPARVDDYLATGDPLPGETVSYVNDVAPHLGNATPMTGPLAVYAGNNSPYATSASGACDPDAAYDPDHPCTPLAPVPQAPVTLAAAAGGYCDPNAAYDPNRPCVPAPQPAAPMPVRVASNPFSACDPDAAYDPSQPCTPAPRSAAPMPVRVASTSSGTCDADAAYDPSRPCTPRPQRAAPAPVQVAPTTSGACNPDAAYDPSRPCTPEYQRTGPAPYATASFLYRPQPAQPPPIGRAVLPVPEPTVATNLQAGAWAIQVGAFMTPSAAHSAAANTRRALPGLLSPTRIEVSTTEPFGNQVLFRARLTNLTADGAVDACSRLAEARMPCLIVRPS
jgi:D-alanyl-D-alanine carboxypeptidase